MNTLYTWNMTIDDKPVTIEGLDDDNIMIDFPRVDSNIFTAYGQEDLLMCSLYESGDLEDGTILEYAIVIENDGGFYITWPDDVSPDEVVHRLFNLTMHKLSKS